MATTWLAFLVLLTIQSVCSASINFRWCVLQREKAKCDEFITYVNETARNKSLDVAIACVDGSSADDCVTKIQNNQADLVTLKGADVYKAGKTDTSLVPIVSEQYGPLKVRYYAVAVVKKANTDVNIKTLKGKKSCHTGTRPRNAGWNIPIGYLLSSKILPEVACGNKNHDLLSAAKFFSQSCVPGANSAEFNASGDIPGNLCALCAGAGADKCSADEDKNEYAGHEGAFKCMVDSRGDVAFFKHGTVEKAVNKGTFGNLTDYEYLCKDGGRKDIGKHATCNLGTNPAHAVVTRKGNADITNIITILTAMSDMYGANQTDANEFQLFNSTKYNGGEDLMFKDSSTALIAIAGEKQTYQGYLGNDYIKDTEALKSCDMTTTPPPITAVSTITTPHVILVLFTLLLSLMSP